jgi:hypothetical protein
LQGCDDHRNDSRNHEKSSEYTHVDGDHRGLTGSTNPTLIYARRQSDQREIRDRKREIRERKR